MRFNFSTCRLALTVFAVIYLFFTNTALSQNEYNQLVGMGNVILDFSGSFLKIKNFDQNCCRCLSSVCDSYGNLMFYADFSDRSSAVQNFTIYDKEHNAVFSTKCRSGDAVYAFKKSNDNEYFFLAVLDNPDDFVGSYCSVEDYLLYVKIIINNDGSYNVTTASQKAVHGHFILPYIYDNEIFVVSNNDPKSIDIFKIVNDDFVLVNSYTNYPEHLDYCLFFHKLKFNNDCSKIITHDNLFDYDISEHKIIGHKPFMDGVNCIELSEDGYYTYISKPLSQLILRCKTSDINNYENPNIFDTIVSGYRFWDMYSAKDGNIYMTESGGKHISVIKNSNSKDCEFHYHIIDFENQPRNFVFPFVVRTYFSFECNASCQETSFEYHGYPAAAFEWDFGDGTPKVTQKNPIHAYKKNGKYLVTLKVSLTDNSIRTIKKEIEIKNILNNLIIERVD